MRFFILGAFCLLALFAPACSQLGIQESGSTGGTLTSHSGEGGILPFPPVVRDLPNGLRVVLIKTPYPEIVSFHATVMVGSRDEVEPGKSGFAHFFEHMMFRGTEKYPSDVYGEILKKAGADQNAYTTDDYTNYHLTFSRDDLEKVLELEADRFQNLQYSVDQFKTESRAVLGEYNKNYANPIRKLMEYQRDRVFNEHTYKHTTMGFIEDIEDMPNEFQYSRSFYDRFYRPERTILNVVGDIDVEKTFAWVRKYWGNWAPGTHVSTIKREPRQKGPITGQVEWQTKTLPYVAVGFRGPAFSDKAKDMACMDLFSNLLFSESSELYQRLVIEEQKVDQLFAMFPDRKDPQIISVFARCTQPEHAREVRDAILTEFAKARVHKMDREKIEGTKSNLKYSFVHSMDSSEAIAGSLARYVHFDRNPRAIDSLFRVYDSITSDDLRNMARKYFDDSQAHVFTLSHLELPGGDWDRVPSLASLAAEQPAPGAGEAPFEEVIDASSSPLVNFRILFRTGSADDPPGKEGLATMTASMITDAGNRRYSYKELTDLFYPMAAELENQVDKEMTVFSGVIHRDNLDKYYDVVRACLLEPAWDVSDFQRVKTNLINSIQVDLVDNNDEELGKEALYQEIYRGHPYGHLNLGAVSSVEGITIDDCRRFYQSNFTQANLMLGLAGDVSDSFLSRVRGDLSTLPVGEDSRRAVPEPAPIDGWKMTIVQKENRATGIHWGFPIDVTRSHEDFTALWLIRSFFGEHRSSNSYLYQRIREIRGMNYGDYAYIEYFPRGMFQFHPDPNLGRQQQIFQVWIRPVVPANAQFALRVSLWEFDKLLKQGLTEEQFEATRQYLSKYVNILVKTQDRQLGYAMDSQYYRIDDFARKIRSELASLTLNGVNDVLRRHLQRENIHFVVVAKDAEGLRETLLRDEPSTIQYDGEKEEDLLAEDRTIHRYKLGFEPRDIRIVEAADVFAGASEVRN